MRNPLSIEDITAVREWPASETLCIEVDDYTTDPGLAGNASTNDAAFEAALADLEDRLAGDPSHEGGCLVFSAGVYNFSQTIHVTRDSICLKGCQTVLNWHGSDLAISASEGVTKATAMLAAVRFGSSSGVHVNGGISGITIRKDELTWPGTETSSSLVGLSLVNASHFRAYGLSVHNFTTGIRVHADTEDGCTDNVFHLGRMMDNQIGVRLSVSDEGTITDQNFVGGHWLTSGSYADCDVFVPGPSTSRIRFTGCTFAGGALAGVRLVDTDEADGASDWVEDVYFLGCRFHSSESLPVCVPLWSAARLVTLVGCDLVQGSSSYPALWLADGAGIHTLLGTTITGSVLDTTITGSVLDLQSALRGIWTVPDATSPTTSTSFPDVP